MKPPPRDPASIDAVRSAAKDATESLSLRSVAQAIGMSAPGLQHFIAGGNPRPATAQLLREWYVREAAAAGDIDPATLNIALSLLVESFPLERRAEAQKRLVETLRDLHGEKPPGWLG